MVKSGCLAVVELNRGPEVLGLIGMRERIGCGDELICFEFNECLGASRSCGDGMVLVMKRLHLSRLLWLCYRLT